MTLPAFKTEADFREAWVKPFLVKLGFVLVTHFHGTSEQGKDFFFADYDKLEHLRLYSAQVKFGSIRAGKTELAKLLDQVRASFDVRIRDRRGVPEAQRISAAYVMASGRISEAARQRIADHCRREPYGDNVYFLDADRLEALEHSAAYREDRASRSIVNALLREAQVNIRLLTELQRNWQRGQSIPLTRQRLMAIESSLVMPPSPDIMSIDVVDHAWNSVAAVNNVIDLLQRMPVVSAVPEREWQLAYVERALECCKKLEEEATRGLARLDAKTQLEIDTQTERRESPNGASDHA